MKAILVDLDGTLVDTYAANLAAYKAAITEFGLVFELHELELTVGRLAWKQMLSRVLPRNEDKHLIIAKRKRELYPTFACEIKVNKVLVNFLRMLQGVVPIALVTAASSESVEAVLRAKSLNDLFSVIVTSEDVDNQKPDPEPYQKASRMIGVLPEECIVLEDSDIGIAAAKAFGAQVWRVEWLGAP